MTATSAPGRLFAGRTTEERRAERRARLLAAAGRIYGERGYRNATVKAVCDAAGLTERYFYESFANSEDLLCACFQDGADALLTEVRRAGSDAGGPPRARALAGLLVYLSHLRERPASARMFLIEMSSVSSRADRLVSENLDRFGALLAEIFQGADTRPSHLLVRGAIGGGLHIAQAWISDGYTEPVETVADTILRLYALVGEG